MAAWCAPTFSTPGCAVRYYDLTLNPEGNNAQVFTVNDGGGFTLKSKGTTFTSYVNGQTVPGALNIEFDVKVTPFNTPQGGSIIRVWGVGLQMISQQYLLTGAHFKLQAGMKPGLPLAIPQGTSARAGTIAEGTVFQAFGNWQGVNQTLDLVCNPGDLAPAQGIAFRWTPGQTLPEALQSSFAQAFPTYPAPTISINPNLQPPKAAAKFGWYENLANFSQMLSTLTQSLGSGLIDSSTGKPVKNYPGVQIVLVGNQFNIYDGTTQPAATQLVFADLIGQPTWISGTGITFKTVLRSDVAAGTLIKFPTGVSAPYALTSAEAAAPGGPARSKTVFQGSFVVNEVHHYANFRQSDAESWNTTFTAAALGE